MNYPPRRGLGTDVPELPELLLPDEEEFVLLFVEGVYVLVVLSEGL